MHTFSGKSFIKSISNSLPTKLLSKCFSLILTVIALKPTEIKSISDNNYFGLTSDFDNYYSGGNLVVYYEPKFNKKYKLIDEDPIQLGVASFLDFKVFIMFNMMYIFWKLMTPELRWYFRTIKPVQLDLITLI